MTQKHIGLILSAVVCAQGVFVEPPEASSSQRSLAESETRLPCRYQVEEQEQVVQVTWFKEHGDGAKEQIITAHFTGDLKGRLQQGESGRALPTLGKWVSREKSDNLENTKLGIQNHKWCKKNKKCSLENTTIYPCQPLDLHLNVGCALWDSYIMHINSKCTCWLTFFILCVSVRRLRKPSAVWKWQSHGELSPAHPQHGSVGWRQIHLPHLHLPQRELRETHHAHRLE